MNVDVLDDGCYAQYETYVADARTNGVTHRQPRLALKSRNHGNHHLR
jgi:hypothetical protein